MVEEALTPIEQKTVTFYEDEITAVVVDDAGRKRVYVPVRPLCDHLEVSWSTQLQRIRNDAILSKEVMSVLLETQTSDPTSRRPNTSAMICLPLDRLNGWLFGINANRVKEELRERLTRYQWECYDVLAQAFQSPAVRPDASSTLMQVREMGLAIAKMAEEQMEFDRRLAVQEGRMEKAAVVVGDLRKRVTAVEQKLTPGRVVTDDQASQISQAVKGLALALGRKSGKNEFAGVYSALHQQFGISAYKMLPARRFEEAMKFLTDWHGTLKNDSDE